MTQLTALLDANVLYAAGLRDILLRLANQYLYIPLWSARIHEEWIHNLLKNRPDLPVEKLRRTQAEMDEHFPAAVVTGYESLIKEISLPDSGDHHVLAAAAHGKADIIVTLNLQDFPSTQLARYALSARHPDTFIAGLFDAWPQEFLLAIREHESII